MEKEEIENLLSNLISIESISGNEEKVSDYIQTYIEDLGVETINHKGNIIAVIDNNSEKALHFNAHMDTVKANADKWDTDPLTAVEKDGKIFGLGASDLKGSIAALLAALDELKDIDLDCDLYFTFVKNEEVDGSGTKETLEHLEEQGILSKYSKQACVLTEPTDLEIIEIGCKGSTFIEIKTHGKSCHGKKPEKGVNAVLKMNTVIEDLKTVKSKLEDKKNKHLGFTSIAIGTKIEAKGSVNSVPAECKLTCDVRTIPSTHGEVKKLIKENLSVDAEVNHYSEPSAPSYTPPDSEIVSLIQEITGAELDTAKGADDSCFYQEKGIDTAVIGPGQNKVIHTPNEYIVKDKLFKAAKIYEEIAKSW